MYGLINSSLQSMIREKFGEEQWNNVLKASGVPEDSFLSMRSYDDAITYDLVGAASEVLGAPGATAGTAPRLENIPLNRFVDQDLGRR